jgi:arylsulfatase A-like enzyme
LKPNILFLLIDSLTVERFYGNGKNAKTPNIDYLMKNGAFFKQTIGCSDYTGPSIQAVFTSRFPFGCGLTKEHYYKVFSNNENCIEILKNNGYHCHAILEEELSTQGITKPFDKNYELFQPSENLHNGLEKKILDLFDSIKHKEPWFYYIHFMDLHNPCRVPSEYNHLRISERYDFNISAIDACIGKLLKKIDLTKTLIVTNADHGEFINPLDDSVKEPTKLEKSLKSIIKKTIPKSLKQTVHEKKRNIIEKIQVSKLNTREKRGIRTRPMVERTFYDEVIRIPLLFAGYGFNESVIVEQQVRNVDIFPTILELINLPKMNYEVNGKSLVPLIKGKNIEMEPAYMESSILKTATKNPRSVIGIRTEEFKYFRNINDENNNAHLYNLKNDPFEENNLVKENPEIVKKMEKSMEKIRQTAIPQEDQEQLSEDEEKKLEAELKKLGYL